MTLRKGILVLVAAALLAGGAASCARPPADQMRKARTAVTDLRDVVKADKWAPDHFAAVSSMLEKADKEVRAQNSRFFMMRDYAKAAEMYSRALEDAAATREAARTGKERAEKNAREALDAALAAIVHAQAALTVAPVSRDSRASSDLLDQQLDRAASRLDEVRNLIVAEEYKDAAARAGEILEQVTVMLRNVSRNARH